MRKHFICRPLLLGVAVSFFTITNSSNLVEAASLSELLSAVDSTSASILKAQSEVVRARSARTVARAIPNPTVFGSAEELGNVRENTVGLQQDFSFLWSRSASISSASASFAASEAALNLARTHSYSEVLLGIQKLQQLTEQLRLLDNVKVHFNNILHANESRESAGDISAFDAQRVRFEAVSLSNRHAALLSEQQELAYSLGRSTGLSIEDLLQTSLSEITSLPFASSADALTYAREHSPERTLTNATAKATELNVEAASRQRWPALTIGAGRKTTNVDESGFLIEAELELPLFSRRSAEVQIAKAEFYMAKRLQQSTSDKLDADIIRAFDLWKGLSSVNPELLTSDALREYLDTAHDLYMSDEFGYIELLDAFAATRSSQDERFEIESAKLAADLHLRKLTGHPILEKK